MMALNIRSHKIKLKFKRKVSHSLNVHQIIFRLKLMTLSLKVLLNMIMQIMSSILNLMTVIWLQLMVHKSQLLKSCPIFHTFLILKIRPSTFNLIIKSYKCLLMMKSIQKMDAYLTQLKMNKITLKIKPFQ